MDAANTTVQAMYPLMLDLSGRAVLVVGGGSVAERRVAGLLEAGAHVTVVAPAVTTELRAWADSGTIAWQPRTFEAADLEGVTLAFTATGEGEIDGAVAAAARADGILVNSADDNGRCDFHVPAIARRGDIVIAVGTGGAAPALASKLRDRFAASLGPEWERFARFLGQLRTIVRERVAEPSERFRLLGEAANDPSLLARAAQDGELSAEEVLGELEAGSERPAAAPDGAFVSLVGAGPGAPDLLTVRAYERIRSADAIVFDDLVDRRVLEEARPGAELVYSGKRGWRDVGERPGPQVLAELALEGGGRRVVRLKGGDPNVFGRSTEEIMALVAAGVPYEVVPGVTAALAAAAAAGISLTKRGVARSITLATGVSIGPGDGGDDAPSPAEVASLVRAGNTVAVYMGLRSLPVITNALLGAGVAEDLGVAVVGSASLPTETVVRGELSDIARLVADREVGSPAIVILGEVVDVDE